MPSADEKGAEDDPKARRAAAAPAIATTAEQTPDEPPSKPGNARRAGLAGKGQDPNAPPDAPPTDVVDAPAAPARAVEEDDVEALLLGDRGWTPTNPPAPRLPDLSPWIESPTLGPEVRAAWRRRLGFQDERPHELDPGAALMRAGAVGWVRAAAVWLVDDDVGARLASQVLTPWGPWVARGRAGRLDAARVALVQLALLRSDRSGLARAVHISAQADRLDEFETTVRTRGGRFPTVASLIRSAPAPVLDVGEGAWTPTVRRWLDVRPMPFPFDGPQDALLDEAIRRTLAEQGLRLAREVSRLRARAAGALLLIGAQSRPLPASVASAAAAVDALTQPILVGLGVLGRGLHQVPPMPLADARRALAALGVQWAAAIEASAAQVAAVADALGPPPPERPSPAALARRLSAVARTAPDLSASSRVDAAIGALLAGDTPQSVDGAPACEVVVALDRVERGDRVEDVIAQTGRALLAHRASGMMELLLRAI